MYSRTCCHIRNCTKVDIRQQKKRHKSGWTLKSEQTQLFCVWSIVSIVLCSPACQRWTDWGPVPSVPRCRNLKTEFSLWKHIERLQSTLRWRNLKMQQSPVILDSCLKKTRSGPEITWLLWHRRVRFHNVSRLHENEQSAFLNSSGWNSVFEKPRWCKRKA